ncbi:MAG: hypothetical protein KBA95_15980 [Acidobacteria bacterium]|nr:hypothetical protein [Acidobacteriota bacterium]
MKWLRTDCTLDDHPDIIAAGFYGARIFEALLRTSKKFDLGGSLPAKYAAPRYLARQLGLDEGLCADGLEAAARAGLIERDDPGDVVIPGWEDYNGDRELEEVREKARKRTAAFRERQKARAAGAVTPPAATVTPCDVTQRDGHDVTGTGRDETGRYGTDSPPGGGPAALAQPAREESQPEPPTEPAPGLAPEPEGVPAASRSPGAVPVAALVDAWNGIAAAAGAVACRKVPDAWKGAIRARWFEAGSTDDERMAAFRAQFEAVASSRLCTGRVAHGDRRPWRASLDWLVKASNWAKVANGNYLDDPAPVRPTAPSPAPPRPEPAWAKAGPEVLAATVPEARELWRAALDLLRARVDPRGVSTWIEPLEPLGLVDNVLVLAVSDDFAGRWVSDNYLDVIRDALWDVRQRQIGVGLRIASDQEVAA